MPKLPRNVKARDLVKALTTLGFSQNGQVGSHLKMAHSDGRWTTIPVHPKPIPIGTFKAILRQSGVSVEDILKNL